MPDVQSDQTALTIDLKTKFLWGIRIRYAIIIFGLVLTMIAVFFRADIVPLSRLLGFLIVYGFGAHLVYSQVTRLSPRGLITAISVFQLFDVFAVTYLIYITGWLESPYWFLYLVLIIISGFGFFSRYSSVVFLIALVSAFLYLGMLLSAYFGIIPEYGMHFSLSPNELLSLVINRAVFTIVSFFLFASTIYYFSQLLSQHQEELRAKNEQLLAALQEMKNADRLKDEFLTTASHELRTPLTVIRENISLIKDGVAGEVNEKQQALMASLLEHVDRMSGILNNILDISKMSARPSEVKQEETELSRLAARAVGFMREIAKKKNIEIEEQYFANTITLADPDQILRVFINLLDNAVKYTRENGRIIVIVGSADGEVICSVEDNGIGIEQKELPLLFERFVRLESGVEMSPRGSGLGLSICKTIIDMHRGRIWVESRVGSGTKFTFSLPRRRLNG
ncbi:MAG: MFS domain-containing histidine kinase [Candidatus Margulisbacteria bacterium]|nr:MFS domain-containing histidine kinase [Candidatus Margulisiibacteriota bacterium]